jgi:hypothetical protein
MLTQNCALHCQPMNEDACLCTMSMAAPHSKPTYIFARHTHRHNDSWIRGIYVIKKNVYMPSTVALSTNRHNNLGVRNDLRYIFSKNSMLEYDQKLYFSWVLLANFTFLCVCLDKQKQLVTNQLKDATVNPTHWLCTNSEHATQTPTLHLRTAMGMNTN